MESPLHPMGELPPSDQAILTGEEVRAILRMKKSHFSKVVNGKIKGTPPIPFFRIGRCQRFVAGSLRKWIREREQANGEPSEN
jgi:hypothetical protein